MTKKLNQMNNVDRAKLLYTLIPNCCIEICKAIIDVSNEINANADELSKTWDFPIISFNAWQHLGNELAGVVIKYDGGEKIKSASVFADQLFDGYFALFAWHCVRVAAKNSEIEKFMQAVDLLN